MNLRDLIEGRIHLGKESSTGFFSVKCEVCSDHSERAGFKFDGDEVGYSCFNCGCKARSKDGKGKMGAVLAAFGISPDEVARVQGELWFNKGGVPEAPKPKPVPSPKPFNFDETFARMKNPPRPIGDHVPEFPAAQLARIQADYPQYDVRWDGSLWFVPRAGVIRGH